jgi:hypothetical protein
MSTHDLVRVRNGASSIDIWRNAHRTLYWKKDMWIVPIHQPGPGSAERHWVLRITFVRTHQLLLFDSLAGLGGWANDLKVCLFMILSAQDRINSITLVACDHDDTYYEIRRPCSGI